MGQLNVCHSPLLKRIIKNTKSLKKALEISVFSRHLRPGQVCGYLRNLFTPHHIFEKLRVV
jgi:hypothetical protein